jgi:cytochrome P450
VTPNKQFFQALENIRTIRWEMNAMAHAFRQIQLDGPADKLKALSENLDEVVDKLTEDREAETPRRSGDILSAVLIQSIEDDEARTRI